MSDLQTDIQTVSDGFGCGHTTAEQDAALENVERAAQLVANLDPTVWDDMLAEAFYGESFIDLSEERQWVREFEYELVTALGLTPQGATK